MQPLDFLRDLALITGLAGGLALDRRGAFQLMLGQPLVAVWLLGLWFGEPVLGLTLGAVLQLLWMSSSLFGANVPPNETVASLAIGGMVFLVRRYVEQPPTDHALVATAALLGAPLCLAGRWLEVRNDRANARLAARADAAVRADDLATFARLPWVGLGRTFLWNAALVGLTTAAGFGLLVLLTPALRPIVARTGLEVVAVYVLPAVGVGVALSHLRRRRGLLLALVAFVVMLLLQAPEPSP